MRFLVFLLAALLSPSQEAVHFVPLGVQNGLANRKVYQVAQDGDGYLWFYAQNSIDRYDGFEFRHYELGAGSREGNYQATSNTLSIDPDGIVHVAQTNGRVYRYDKRTDRFEQAFSVFPTNLYALLFRDDRTWLGTANGLISLPEGKSYLSERSVHCLTESQGKIYAGTDKGVYEISDSTVRRLDGCPPVLVTAVIVLEDGRLFAGTFADGVFCVDGSSGERLPSDPGFPDAPVRRIVRSGDRLLFATDGAGVVVYDLARSEISDFYTSDDTDHCLCANTVSDVLVDRDGILWVTTTTDGICFSDPTHQPTRWIRHVAGVSNSLPSNHVNSVMEDSSGRIWFGTNQGLCRWENGRWRHFNIPGSDVILMTVEDPSGTVWAGGYGFPLFSIDTKDRVKVLDPGRFHHVFSLEMADNRLWIGDIDAPLTCIDLTTGQEETFEETGVWDIFYADDIWVASHTGLGKLAPADKAIQWLTLPEGVIGAWCITRDNSGRIWAGMESGGIVCYNPSDGTAINYPLEETVFDILPDEAGAIWAVSGELIYRIDPARRVPVVMNRFLGIGAGEFNHTAATRLSDGRFVFGTANGAIVFDPAQEGGDVEMKPVIPVLTSFRLLSGDAAAVLKDKVINSLDRLVLNWADRSFAISYSALAMIHQERILFEYKMEGLDTRSQSSLSAGTAEYDRLPAGSYSFKVMAVDALTGDVLGERALPITIRRPILLSWGALALYAVLLSILALLLVRYQKNRKSRRIAQERLDNFIRFAHELKTPVSLIKAPLAALDKDSSLSPQSREPVSTALRNADRLMGMINSLLDLRQDDAASRQLHFEICDLEDYLGESLNAFLPIARHKGIALTYAVANGLDKVPIDHEKMDHIIQNLVSNAVKYTETGSVTVTAEPAGRSWKLQVRDTGIGIPAEVRSRIFHGGIRAANARNVDETGYGIGLMICRQLVLQLKGSISLSSEKGAGTTLTLYFPMEYKPSEGLVLDRGEEADVTESSSEGVRPRIIIVEDDDEMLRYLRELLASDFEIMTASDGTTALSIAEEVQPDLVLSDIIMSGMNGFDLCRRLKSNISTSHVPVILLTAMDDKEHVIMGLEAGADDYIVKPFDPQVLKARLNNLFHERERLRATILSSGRREKQREYTNRLDKEFMEKVLSVMEASYPNPEFQVDDLCRSVAMSRTALFNKLKALSGKGPNDFIRIYRLEKAKALLESGEYTIAEVADEVGFSDAKYFSSCFKRAFGVSPSKY